MHRNLFVSGQFYTNVSRNSPYRQTRQSLVQLRQFGDDPSSLVEEVLAMIEKPLDKFRSKSKPELMTEIYVERDRALIKQEILNRVMAG